MCVCAFVCVHLHVFNEVTVRVVHQKYVHSCVLWEAMYYMFTSGGQFTTYVLFIQSHCRLANLLSLLVTSTQPPGHTTALDGLWSVVKGASTHGLELAQHFPLEHANGINVRNSYLCAQFLLTLSTSSHVYAQKKQAVKSHVIQECAYLMYSTVHEPQGYIVLGERATTWGTVSNAYLLHV